MFPACDRRSPPRGSFFLGHADTTRALQFRNIACFRFVVVNWRVFVSCVYVSITFKINVRTLVISSCSAYDNNSTMLSWKKKQFYLSFEIK